MGFEQSLQSKKFFDMFFELIYEMWGKKKNYFDIMYI